MQVSKKDGNRYVKELDKVDLYLLNMMKRFFTADTNGIKECAESIILEAVKRAKDEIVLNGKYGVYEIMTNSGVPKSGIVTLTPGDIGAEPEILIKHSAFNKAFGNEHDTVCEGDDPRLSDARDPLPHEHPEYLKASDLHLELATETDKGLMSPEDKTKLDGLDKYVHPTTPGWNHVPAGGKLDQYLAWGGDGIAVWADNPLLTLVSETKDGMMSKLDKIKLDNIEDEANHYVHPITSGFKHIPAGGKAGQILIWNDLGEAKWGDMTIIPLVTESVDGIMSKEDKKKLDGIEDGANKYAHPTTSGNKHIPSGGKTGQELTWKADGEAQWSDPKSNPVGNDGQVYYIDGDVSSTLAPSYILLKAAIVENDAELNDLKSRLVDFNEVFSSWYRFSHNRTSAQPAVVDDYNSSTTLANAWTLTGSQVVCVPNSTSYIGFVSKEKYSDYTLEATVKSANSDNDRIGIVVAFATDSSGVEHTLSALRDQETVTDWFLVYDYCRTTERIIGSLPTVGGEVRSGWSAYPNGSRIRVERVGDKIDVYCSPFNTTVIDPTSKLSVDLSTDPFYSVFRGKSAYGYACQSQAESTFTDIVFSGAINTIYDIETKQTWVNNPSTGWTVDTSKEVSSDIGVGRFVFNEYTKKLFYINGKNDVILCSGESEKIQFTSNNDILFTGLDQGIRWSKDTDGGAIYMDIGADFDDNHMVFETRDNGTEWFKWQHVAGSVTAEWMSLKNDGLRVFGKRINQTFGPTSSRPPSPTLGDAPYLDTTINKVIWWNGSNWMDAMGNAV